MKLIALGFAERILKNSFAERNAKNLHNLITPSLHHLSRAASRPIFLKGS